MNIEQALLVLIAGAAVLTASQASADKGKIELLGQPCRAKNVLSGDIIVDRRDGRERFALANMNENVGAELVLIDPEKNNAEVFNAPDGQGSWGLMEVPGDRLVLPMFHDGVYVVFDLKKAQFTAATKFPGEKYIWTAAVGNDGRVYGGTYPGGKLGALDLDTYEVEDLGAPAPPNLYLRNVSALPDGRIYCFFFTEKPTYLIFDPATKEFTQAPAHLHGLETGISWNGYFVAGSVVCDGKTLDKVNPPFPTPPAGKGDWNVDVLASNKDTLVIRQGNAIYRYKTGDKELTLVADIDLRGGWLFAVNKKDEIYGIRGQDYFILKPGDKDISLKPMPGEYGARPTLFLRVDEKGRIWGGPHFGQTLFHLDPKTKKTVNTGTVCDAAGEVYDVTFKDGKVYAIAYTGGDIVCYDPAKPWDQWNNENPKTIASLNARGYIRPEAGILFGPDGKLYSGLSAEYGEYGGAVSITDPETGETELIENPLGKQTVRGVAVDKDSIYIGTSLSANGLPNKSDESAKFGVIDLKTRKITFEHAFDGASNVRVLACWAGRVAIAVNGKIRFFDAEKSKLMDNFADDVPGLNGNSVGILNGKLYYASAGSICELDMITGRAQEVGSIDTRVSNVAVAKDGTIYFSSGTNVYALHR